MHVGVDIFLQSLLNGLVMGGIYALTAVGMTLVFGVMRIINIAHGEFIMMGMYLAFFLNVSLGMDPYLSILVIVPIMFLVGMAFYSFLIKPAIDKGPMNQVMITIGCSIVMINVAMLLCTSDYRSLNLNYFIRSFQVGKVMIGLPQLIAFCGSLGATAFLYWLLVYTKMGRMIRAVSQNRKAATLMGVNVNWVFQLSMGLVACCAGVAGVLVLPIYYVFPEVGQFFLMFCFVIIVLGGMGNFLGALVGGILVGMVEAIGSLFLPGSLPLLATWVLLIIFLLVRPEGIFGEGAV